jgi:hypothetical protein
VEISTVWQLADHLRGANPTWSHNVFADGSVVSVRRDTAGRPATLRTGPGWGPRNEQIVPLTLTATGHTGTITPYAVIVGSTA